MKVKVKFYTKDVPFQTPYWNKQIQNKQFKRFKHYLKLFMKELKEGKIKELNYYEEEEEEDSSTIVGVFETK